MRGQGFKSIGFARKTQASFRSEAGFMPASGEKSDSLRVKRKAIGVCR